MVKASAQDEGKRLDVFICAFFLKEQKGFSRTLIQKMILEGKVAIDGVPSPKPHYKVRAGQEVKVSVADKAPAAPAAEDIPLEVVFEDDAVAVIDKPSGMVVHPAPGNYAHTLVNALLWRFESLSDINPERPGIVHRLDKETSGLLVVAKTNFAHLSLVKQFAKHSIARTYIALVKGKMEFDEHIVELPIGRHPYKRKSMSVAFGEKARYARTYYRTLKRSSGVSMLELKPFTGRTHQLRVHLAYIGHPILGDTKYGRNNEFERLALHAKLLGFAHPSTGAYVEFSSDIPRSFKLRVNNP